MAFIPEDARWFVGDFVESIEIEGEPSLLIHINTLLIEAKSAEEAFEKALQLGAEMNMKYVNTSGAAVVCKFEGLQELNVIYDDLEHGSELFFRSISGVERRKVLEMVTQKKSLAVFRDITKPAENYFPLPIAQELRRPNE